MGLLNTIRALKTLDKAGKFIKQYETVLKDLTEKVKAAIDLIEEKKKDIESVLETAKTMMEKLKNLRGNK